MGRLRSGSRLLGRIGSGIRVSASFKKNSLLGSVAKRGLPPRGFFRGGGLLPPTGSDVHVLRILDLESPKRRPAPKLLGLKTEYAKNDNFYRRKMPVRPSVFLSVTRRYSVKTVIHILKLFSRSGSHTILVFARQTVWQYSEGDPPHGSVECNWVMKKIAIFHKYLALSWK